MKRREFLLVTGLLTVPSPGAAQAVSAQHRIAWLSQVRAPGRTFLTPFVEGMAALGYVEGRNLVIDARWSEGSRETMERLALEVAALGPAAIVAQGPALLAARKIPATIPVVFGFSGDPVELGVAQSLARPGGHFTGVTFLALDLVGKRVELLREVLPHLKRMAVLSRPDHPGDSKELSATREAAARFGIEALHYPARNALEVDSALVSIASARVEALMVHPDGTMVQKRETIAQFSIQHRIPVVSGWAEIAEAGTLMTYGPNLQECYRRLAYFVDRILRGAKPADLPIELPRSVELVVNLRTARALGLTIPQSLLLRADEVIQ